MLLSLPRFLLVRRKILRLYWAGAIVIIASNRVVTAICGYAFIAHVRIVLFMK